MHSIKNKECMSIQKFYRYPWTREKVDILIQYWPHFGTWGTIRLLSDLTSAQIKAKATKLKLHLLPKNERLCFECRTKYQFARRAGLRCKQCYLSKRKDIRSSKQYDFNQWMQEVARTCRYRSKEDSWITSVLLELQKCKKTNRHVERYNFNTWINKMLAACRYKGCGSSDVTASFLSEIWKSQKGICYYSGLPMTLPEYKNRRSPFTASIDRKNPSKGYTRGNIVWCCWACNCGKNCFSIEDYIFICKSVVKNNIKDKML
jgi:hypothetical protein